MDAGLAAIVSVVVGAVIGVVGTIFVGWQQRRTDDARSKTEWDRQQSLVQTQLQHDLAMRREQWERDQQLAVAARLRQAELRRIDATRRMCLTCLDDRLSGIFAPAPDPAKTVEWSLGHFPEADLALLGSAEALATYARSIHILLGFRGTGQLPENAQRAFNDASSTVMDALREQENRANRGEPVLRSGSLDRAQIPAEILSDPAWHAALYKPARE